MKKTPAIQAKRQAPRIGFYGCGNADRLVRVNANPGGLKNFGSLLAMQRASFRIPECPACGQTHVTKIMFRKKRTPREKFELQLKDGWQLKTDVYNPRTGGKARV